MVRIRLVRWKVGLKAPRNRQQMLLGSGHLDVIVPFPLFGWDWWLSLFSRQRCRTETLLLWSLGVIHYKWLEVMRSDSSWVQLDYLSMILTCDISLFNTFSTKNGGQVRTLQIWEGSRWQDVCNRHPALTSNELWDTPWMFQLSFLWRPLNFPCLGFLFEDRIDISLGLSPEEAGVKFQQLRCPKSLLMHQKVNFDGQF